eukprot:5015415-Amphidinium_carterae.1
MPCSKVLRSYEVHVCAACGEALASVPSLKSTSFSETMLSAAEVCRSLAQEHYSLTYPIWPPDTCEFRVPTLGQSRARCCLLSADSILMGAAHAICMHQYAEQTKERPYTLAFDAILSFVSEKD